MTPKTQLVLQVNQPIVPFASPFQLALRARRRLNYRIAHAEGRPPDVRYRPPGQVPALD